MPVSDGSLRELSRTMAILGSEVRLRILRRLREPARVSEIRVEAAVSRGGERQRRTISRQAVAHHLEKLQAAGLVKTSPVGGDDRGGSYLLNHERLFALTDELRQLNRLRPFLDAGQDPHQTITSHGDGIQELPRLPRLLEAYGGSEGRAFPLPADGARVLVGRDPTLDLHLDHDPYVSAHHCALETQEGRWMLTDLGSRNGSWINWQPVPADTSRPLERGDLLQVGRTQLVFQG